MNEPNVSSTDDDGDNAVDVDATTSSEFNTSASKKGHGSRAARKERLMKTKHELKAEVNIIIMHYPYFLNSY